MALPLEGGPWKAMEIEDEKEEDCTQISLVLYILDRFAHNMTTSYSRFQYY